MKISFHAGHGNDGGKAQGAVGYCSESKYARKIVNSMKTYWNDAVPYNDATVNSSTLSQREILSKLASRINDYNPDLAISVHMNSFSSTEANGIEVVVHPNTSVKNKAMAAYIASDLASCFGFRNRGVKENKALYILNKTKCPCMIIEIGFCTNYNDSKIVMKQYDAIGARLAKILSGDVAENKLYDVKVYGVDEKTAKQLTDVAYNADATYQKIER